MLKIQLDHPFPGAIPPRDGAIFELAPDGSPILLIQYRQPFVAEEAALNAGFERYSIFGSSTPPHLACWVWKFPAPIGYIDSPFHASLYADGRVERFIRDCGNMLHTFVLDGETVKTICASGLSHQAIKALKDIVRRQLAVSVDRFTYDAAVDRLFRLDSKEIFRRGMQFRHR